MVGKDKNRYERRRKETKRPVKHVSVIQKTILTSLCFLFKTALQAEIKMNFKTISRTDKLAIKLTKDTDQKISNPEDYIEYSTQKNSQITQKSDNFQLIGNLGKDDCNVMKTYLTSSGEENIYLICNKNEIKQFSKNPTVSGEIYKLKKSSKVKKSSKFSEPNCVNVIEFKDVASSKMRLMVICQVKDVTGLVSYKLADVIIGSEIDLEAVNVIDMTMEKQFPLEPEMEIFEGMIKLKKKDGNVVNAQTLVFYRKPPLKILNSQTEYENKYVRIVNLVDKTVSLFDLNQNELKTLQLSLVTSVYLLDPVTFLISGFTKSKNFLTTFKIVKNDADFKFKEKLKEYKLPEDVKKGFAQIELYRNSKGVEQRLVTYSDLDKKLHGICLVDFKGDRGYIQKCKYEQSLADSVCYRSLGCINENQCFFGFKNQADFTTVTGYSRFTVDNERKFPSNFKIFFKGKKLAMNSKFALIGLSSENWLKEFNQRKVTVFEIDCSKLTKSPEELIIEKKTYNPKDKKTTSDSYKIQISSVPSLFTDFRIPGSMKKIFWYLETIFNIDNNNGFYNGNALQFSTEGKGIETFVISDNEVNLKFQDKRYENFDESKTQILPFGGSMLRMSKKTGFEFFSCEFEEKNKIEYNCKFIKKISIGPKEKFSCLFNLDDTTDIILTDLSGEFKSKLFFIMGKIVIEKTLDYKVLSFEAIKVKSSIHLIMAVSRLDDKKNPSNFLTRTKFDKTGTDSLSMSSLYQVPLSSTGKDLKCVRKIVFLSEKDEVNLLDNCGNFQDSLTDIKIDQKGKITNSNNYRFYDEGFSNFKKDSLQFCYRGDQLLLAEIGSSKIRLTRKNLLEFEEDLGLKQLNIEKISQIYCPKSSDGFLILGEVKATKDQKGSKFKAVVYKWDRFQNAENRIMSQSREILNLINPVFSYKSGKFFMNYMEQTTKKDDGTKATLKTKIISFMDTRAKVMIKSKVETISNVNLVVKSLSREKKIPISGEFSKYDETLKIEVQGIPYIEEKSYKLDDIANIDGPILEIKLRGDKYIQSNLKFNHRIEFQRDFEDFKRRERVLSQEKNPLKKIFNENKFSGRILQDSKDFLIMKTMKYKNNIIGGLVDINKNSRILLYNNTKKLEKRIDYTTSCKTFGFDIVKKTEEMVIAAICQDPAKKTQNKLNLKMTNLDGFKIATKEILSKNPQNFDQISTWIGKDSNDVILVTWNLNNKKLALYRIDASKASLIKNSKVYESVITKIWEVSNGKKLILNYFF